MHCLSQSWRGRYLLLLHALTCSNKELVIPPNTDVFLLMIYLYPWLPLRLHFLQEWGWIGRLQIKPIFDELWSNHASAILGFHAFTGSDVWQNKGMVYEGVHVLWYDNGCLGFIWTNFIKVYQKLFLNWKGSFACPKYTPSNGLHWILYSNRGAEGESLLPTSGSLEQRAHYIAMIIKAWLIKEIGSHLG